MCLHDHHCSALPSSFHSLPFLIWHLASLSSLKDAYHAWRLKVEKAAWVEKHSTPVTNVFSNFYTPSHWEYSWAFFPVPHQMQHLPVRKNVCRKDKKWDPRATIEIIARYEAVSPSYSQTLSKKVYHLFIYFFSLKFEVHPNQGFCQGVLTSALKILNCNEEPLTEYQSASQETQRTFWIWHISTSCRDTVRDFADHL